MPFKLAVSISKGFNTQQTARPSRFGLEMLSDTFCSDGCAGAKRQAAGGQNLRRDREAHGPVTRLLIATCWRARASTWPETNARWDAGMQVSGGALWDDDVC